MKTGSMLYEGKAKKMYATDDPAVLLVDYKNSLTAFNAQKKAEMEGKGRLNNLISSRLFEYLNEQGIPTHFIERIDENRQLVKKVDIIPVEVVTRNITTGTLCRRLGVEEGMVLPYPLVEYYLKSDELGDPIIMEDHAILFNWSTKEELEKIREITLRVNQLLKKYFEKLDVILVDFKLEFGKDCEGNLLLSDEISPDTCRFWDRSSGEKLDKDRFRKDLGNVLGAYEEIWSRITSRGE